MNTIATTYALAFEKRGQEYEDSVNFHPTEVVTKDEEKKVLLQKLLKHVGKTGTMVKEVPIGPVRKQAAFKSQAQRGLFYAKARRGEMSMKTVRKWERETPKGKKLPKHVKKAGVIVREVIGKPQSQKGLMERIRESKKPRKQAYVNALVKRAYLGSEAIPFRERLTEHKGYLKAKSRDIPPTIKTVLTAGGVTGGGIGLLLGLAARRPVRGGAKGAILGAGAGMLIGLAVRLAEKGEIAQAKRIVNSGQFSVRAKRDLIGQLEKVKAKRDWEAERRHRQMVSATAGR